MPMKKYKNVGELPLAFTDGQDVEVGEEFDRDFENSDHPSQESFLLGLGSIVVVPSTPPPAEIQKAVRGSHPVPTDGVKE